MTTLTGFEGRVAIVTGAARGMGRSHALELGRRGASVIVNDLNGAEDVAAEIRAEGGKAVAVTDSVATPEGGEAIVSQALEHFGTVDIVVHNAGFMRNNYIEDLTPQQIRDVMDVHVMGGFWVTQPAWRVMKAKGYGRVVLISSDGGLVGFHAAANYCAAKAGLYGLMRGLSFEGAPHGIRVNAVTPSADTTINVSDPMIDWEKFYPSSDHSIFEGRRLPESVTSLVTYLASEECTVNGEALQANSGLYSRWTLGLSRGWLTPEITQVSAEDIRDHIDQIRDLTDHIHVESVMDEVGLVSDALKAART